jgi:uncharacterized membrane protein YqhA
MTAGIFLRLRYLAIVIIAILVVHTLGLLAIGAVRAYEAYRVMFGGGHWTGQARPGIHIAESVDALLFALVLIVVSSGTASLFFEKAGQAADPRLPAWIHVRDLSELKFLIWEGMLVVFVTAALASFIANIENLRWEFLTLPGAVFLLSAGLHLVKRSGGTRE